ncbi:MAG: hypothetical protein ABSF43_15745 [Rectinemataceae bacterium]
MADLLEIFDLERDRPETEEVLEPELKKARERLGDSVRKIRELDLDQACGFKDCACRLKGKMKRKYSMAQSESDHDPS